MIIVLQIGTQRKLSDPALLIALTIEMVAYLRIKRVDSFKALFLEDAIFSMCSRCKRLKSVHLKILSARLSRSKLLVFLREAGYSST